MDNDNAHANAENTDGKVATSINNQSDANSNGGKNGGLKTWQLWLAGIILTTFSILAILLVIGYWPDKVPDKGGLSIYNNKIFHINLIDTSGRIDVTMFVQKLPTACDSCLANDTITVRVKSLKVDALFKVKATDTSTNNLYPMGQKPCGCGFTNNTVQYDTLLLILVALCGFLGNMIHIATSFTTFVGAGKFVKSWLLWYCVKPFTASALAMVLYFVFRAGFLSSSYDGSSISLYGVASLAVMAGLFTDKATLKLKEIFEVVFASKQQARPNALTVAAKIISIAPAEIKKTEATNITIIGTGLDNTLTIKINGVQQNISTESITTDAINLTYTPSAADAAATNFTLEIFDKTNALISSKTFTAI